MGGLLKYSIAELQDNDDPTLFSAMRAKYQAIVEVLLEKDDPSDEALKDFKRTHHSGKFLCRFRHCPRAFQGFDSSHRREEHEATHKPRFKCTDLFCGLNGWTFESRVSMKRHTDQYHKEKATAQIPSTLEIPGQLQYPHLRSNGAPQPFTAVQTPNSASSDFQLQMYLSETQNKKRQAQIDRERQYKLQDQQHRESLEYMTRASAPVSLTTQMQHNASQEWRGGQSPNPNAVHPEVTSVETLPPLQQQEPFLQRIRHQRLPSLQK